jgi:2-polyprenyl-6-methoxyphenol hydroxylase-like FAD-dependent oxidoreductase
MTGRKAIIVGAGIGGLTAAIALRHQGVDATVYERATAPSEVGAGISLAPNALAALAEIGLADRVRALGVTIPGGALRTWRGDPIAAAPRGLVALCVHRADLQRTLIAALGAERVRLAHTVVGIEHQGGHARARFAHGGEVDADLLIGADGLHSAVRAALHRARPPRYAGYTAWRGVAASAETPEATESWGRGARFGIVPIGAGRVYWFATRNAPEGERDEPGRAQATLVEAFGTWHRPIGDLIAATPPHAILRHDLYDRPPLPPPWGRGPTTLLGDAAHPMTPNLGQGACQAIEDAIVLARHLATSGEVEPALRAYERARASRTAGIVRSSHWLGAVAQLQHPVACSLRDTVLRILPRGVHERRIADLVRFDTA